MKLYIKVFGQFIFYLIGTFLHEAAHWIGAKLTLSSTPSRALIEDEDANGNKIQREVAGFTIIPKIKKDSVVYGHVVAMPKFKAAYILIALAPLIWVVALYYILNYYEFLYILIENGSFYTEFNFTDFFRVDNLLIIYISLQLIWASTLSTQDIKMFFIGVFSISFIVIALFLSALYCFYYGDCKLVEYTTRMLHV